MLKKELWKTEISDRDLSGFISSSVFCPQSFFFRLLNYFYIGQLWGVIITKLSPSLISFPLKVWSQENSISCWRRVRKRSSKTSLFKGIVWQFRPSDDKFLFWHWLFHFLYFLEVRRDCWKTTENLLHYYPIYKEFREFRSVSYRITPSISIS